ncbi:MAG: hypothetical protein M1837_001923 [Sclerophora amabilis]|nr:MAG: hypothetical protein M1837_001923 [Sclerophora amabilis]
MLWTSDPSDSHHDPSSPSFTLSPTQRQRRLPSLPSPCSSIPASRRVPSPIQYSGFDRQNRRLQLRHANCRAPAIPTEIVALPSVRSPSMTQASIFYSKRDDPSPRESKINRRTNSQSSSTSSNILGELESSTRRSKRASRKASVDDILVDETVTAGLCEHELKAKDQTSVATADMTLREGSVNIRTPSRAERMKVSKKPNHRKRSSTMESTSRGTSSYILHLEEQLAALQVQVESLTSPKTLNSTTSQIRSLTCEARILRDEVSAWEEKFEERVQEGINERATVESSLKAQIKDLERERDAKEEQMIELEWEVDRLHKIARTSEELEAENKNLSRRLDVLTELLALSPTKSTNFSMGFLPEDAGERKTRKARPKSMVPRISCSPERVWTKSPAPGSLARSTDSASNPAFCNRSLSHVTEAAEYEDLGTPSRGIAISSDSSAIISDGSPVTPTDEPAQATRSRPVSFSSDGSNISDSLNSPVSIISDHKVRRQRKMRHFRSGSCGPKALILPSASLSGSISTQVPPSASEEDPDQCTPKAKRTSLGLIPSRFGPTSSYGSTSNHAIQSEDRSLTPESMTEARHRTITSYHRRGSSRIASISSTASGFSPAVSGTAAQFDSLFAELDQAEGTGEGPRSLSTTTEGTSAALGMEYMMAVTAGGESQAEISLTRLFWELFRLPFRLGRRTITIWRAPIWWLLAMVFGRHWGF